jgi:hypothetical protein
MKLTLIIRITRALIILKLVLTNFSFNSDNNYDNTITNLGSKNNNNSSNNNITISNN